jgi:Flp pilus assembly pilin Flp
LDILAWANQYYLLVEAAMLTKTDKLLAKLLSVYYALEDDTKGLSTVEYVILLILIAVVGIAAWRTFGNTVVTKINAGNSQVSGMGGP